jgi:hypothetical protein
MRKGVHIFIFIFYFFFDQQLPELQDNTKNQNQSFFAFFPFFPHCLVYMTSFLEFDFFSPPPNDYQATGIFCFLVLKFG